MTLRTVSSPMGTAIAGRITRPGYFAELDFAAQMVRLCSFGARTWNSVPWVGASFTCDNFDADGMHASITIFDADAAFEAIAFQGAGIRNRSVRVWIADQSALANGDPIEYFTGVGDSVRSAGGRITIACERVREGVMYAPQRRIGPATGFNYLAAPGTVLQWGTVAITLANGR